jgi:hypothetical protein
MRREDMRDEKKEPAPPAEFVVLYEKLRTPEAEVVMRATRSMRADLAATDEIARIVSDSWPPPFTTYLSG